MQNIARHLISPYSLANEPGVNVDSPKEEIELEPGDIILVRTPGFFYEGFRLISSFDYDHVLVALTRPDHSLHVSPPLARRIQSSKLLVQIRQPLVLRPKLSQEERFRFALECESLVGKDYDLFRMYGILARWLAEKQFHIGRFLPKLSTPQMNNRAWLCTDAVLMCLFRASPKIRKICEGKSAELDFFRTGGASIHDFLKLKEMHLLEVIPMYSIKKQTRLEDSTQQKLLRAWEDAGRTKVSIRSLLFAILISSFFNVKVYRLRLLFFLLTAWLWGSSYLRQPQKYRARI